MKQLMLLILFAGLVLTLSQNIGWVIASVQFVIGLLKPVLIGLALAFVLNIFMGIFEEKLFAGLKRNKKTANIVRPLSLISAFLVCVLLFTVVCFVILPEIGKLFITLKNSLPVWLDRAGKWITGLLDKWDIDITLLDTIDINWKSTVDKLFASFVKGSETVVSTAFGAMGGVISFGSNFILSLVISIYALAQKEKICSFFRSLTKAVLPESIYKETLRITRLASAIFSKYIVGQLTEAVVLSSLCFVGMLIFSFPQALVISVFVAVMALVPIVGAFISAFVGAVLILMQSGFVKAFFFIVFIIVLQQIEGNLIYPKVVGKTIGLPSILVLVSIIVGGNVGGILGILLAVPTCALAYVLIKEFINKRNLSPAPVKAKKEEGGESQPPAI